MPARTNHRTASDSVSLFSALLRDNSIFDPAKLPMLKLAESLAPRYLAEVGIFDEDGTLFHNALSQMVDARRAARKQRVLSTDYDRLEAVDEFLSAREADLPAAHLSETSAHDIAAELGAEFSDAGFCLGLAVAAVFYGGAR